jgi:hypothetical protein
MNRLNQLLAFLLALVLSVALPTWVHSEPVILQPGPESGKDIWTTSVFSYAPGGGGPGGGLNNFELVVGGFGDLYHSLIEFNLQGLPSQASAATLELFAFPGRGVGTTGVYLDRITSAWDWRTQGTGSDRERLWWADRPTADQWEPAALQAPVENRRYSIDITGLYNAWQQGVYPNYGIQLRPVLANNNWSEFYSSDYLADPLLRPRLVVESLSPPQELATQPRQGVFTGEVDPSKPTIPTIVITHGWQPGGKASCPSSACAAPGWVTAMHDATVLRLQREGVSANVVTYIWQEAFTAGKGLDDLIDASRFTTSNGSELARQLIQRLGAGYTGEIHLVGHSLGTLVNAEAVNALTQVGSGLRFSQVTMLDPPLNGTPYSERDFHRLLPANSTVTWVDNYIAALGVEALEGFVTGAPITGAAPNGGLFVPFTHETIQSGFYTPTIIPGTGQGFFFSVVLGDNGGFAVRPDPQPWNPPSPSVVTRTVESLPDTLLFGAGGEGWRIIEGTVEQTQRFVRGTLQNALRLLERSDSSIALDVSFPSSADLLSFDFLFADRGDGDWATLFFGDTLLWSFLGQSFFGDDFIQAGIPLEGLQGQSGRLVFALHGTGEPNAEFLLANLQFRGPSAVPAPPSLLVTVLGGAALWVWAVRRRRR